MAEVPSRGLECPRCEGNTHTRGVGRANNEKVMVRRRVCDECGWYGITAESWIPDTTTIERLDENVRFYRIQGQRRRRAAKRKGNYCGHPRDSDTLTIHITLNKAGPPSCGHLKDTA